MKESTQLKSIFDGILTEGNLVKAVFSSVRKKSLPYKKVTIRPLSLQGDIEFQAEFHYPDHVTHENIGNHLFTDFALELINDNFKQVNILTTESDIQILASKPSTPKIYKKSAIRESADTSHNQSKNYIIPNHVPCDFLIKLGVMDENGNVFQKNYSKFRQINRFLEILRDASHALPTDRPLKIIDFGCGKAYLTFAIYHYFNHILKRDVEIIGLDLKSEVIDFCNDTAKELNYSNLTFVIGDIASFKQENADMIVSLHACDTATDLALINAVSWGCSVILSVPCCQHELFEQISSNPDNAYLKHGLLKDKFTEVLTNGLRGLKLESCGYDVSMVEFTSLEHTSKNVMIKAVHKKNNPAKMKNAEDEFQKLISHWNVNPTISKLTS